MIKPAETVVYRGAPKFQFDVDGNPFPWHITTRGASFARLLDDLYRIDLTMYCIQKNFSTLGPHWAETGSGLSGSMFEGSFFDDSPNNVGNPTFGGRKFPWTITGEGYTLHKSNLKPVTVRIGFFAKSVDSDEEIYDSRRHDHSIYSLDGSMFHMTDSDYEAAGL